LSSSISFYPYTKAYPNDGLGFIRFSYDSHARVYRHASNRFTHEICLDRGEESAAADCILSKQELDEQASETVQQERGETRKRDGVGEHRTLTALFHQDGVGCEEKVGV